MQAPRGNPAASIGGKIVRPLNDEFYGRAGNVVDPFGHCWGIVGPTRPA